MEKMITFSHKILFMRLIFAFAVLLTISACAEDAKALTGEELQGNWEVTEAKRNGKLTRTFSNAYFRFGDNGQMETNFSGESMNGPYEIEEQTIIYNGPAGQVYDIESWEDSTFLMNFEFQGFKFEFLLKRMEE